MFNAYYMHHVQLFIQLRRINKRGTRKITWCNKNLNVFEKDNDFFRQTSIRHFAAYRRIRIHIRSEHQQSPKNNPETDAFPHSTPGDSSMSVYQF